MWKPYFHLIPFTFSTIELTLFCQFLIHSFSVTSDKSYNLYFSHQMWFKKSIEGWPIVGTFIFCSFHWFLSLRDGLRFLPFHFLFVWEISIIYPLRHDLVETNSLFFFSFSFWRMFWQFFSFSNWKILGHFF
jgi:hypothetical protein